MWLAQVHFADGIAEARFDDHVLAVEQARIWNRLAYADPGATVAMAMALLIKDDKE